MSWQLRTDDFGTLIYPAYLAGFDFKSFTPEFAHYYGYGYYWIYFPLFKLIDSPRQIILVVSTINSAILIIETLLIYYLITTYLNIRHGILPIGLSVLSMSFLSANPANLYSLNAEFRTDNESPIFFITWLIVYETIILVLHEHKCKKCIFSIILAITLVWSITVHERMKALIIAFFIVEFLIFIIYKKWIFHPIFFGGTFAIFLLLHKILKQNIISHFFSGASKIYNTKTITRPLLWMFQVDGGLKAFTMTLMGNVHSMLITTYGIAAIGVVICFSWIFICFKRKRLQCTKYLPRLSDYYSPEFIILLLFGIATAIIVGGVAFSWGYSLAISKNAKAITYNRYYNMFCGPVLVGTIAFVCNNTKNMKKIIELSIIVFLIVEKYFLGIVYPFYSGYAGAYLRNAANLIVSIGAGYFFNIIVSFLIAIIVLLCIYVSVIAINRMKTTFPKDIYVSVSVLFAAVCLLVSKCLAIQYDQFEFQFSDRSMLVVEVIDSLKLLKMELPETIYLNMESYPSMRRDRNTIVFNEIGTEFKVYTSITNVTLDDIFIISESSISELDDVGIDHVLINDLLFYSSNGFIIDELKEQGVLRNSD